ncbi:2-oxo acid dehydrogenase subunit E2 [Nocardioides marmoribigeumensis]|uniref:Pyruvate/2-oxoglutarate dehydrogenase complex dihydrolipoamide acyltransferase (E2) component n=1 Tax=Nocardioides marmoribigeumensis TaxID=433649 RepID=A0ABU2BUV6_9ACTN|nr:2-oxo acid dehydrogenase subunit E2 [Nocardioides marmoribigeumensis]MDR7362417.1 pyruvate/2-oxoglutarate dehydrogenase complex dihydrolipoamide acyltransferase (E2) component [Nocardioides marmoribigeumensis]
MTVQPETHTTEKVSRVRRVIAQRMSESLRSTAQLTSVVEADLSAVMEARRRSGAAFRERHGVSLSPFAVVARAALDVIADHPKMASTLDLEAGTVRHSALVNLGVAVDTPEGLIVPNVKSAEQLTLPDLVRAIADLADRTRSRRLRPEDIEGGTFTMTNTGSRGSLLDTPILNYPELAILAVGRVVRRPVVRRDSDGAETIAIADTGFLCLTYDHRLIDGADAARFLEDIRTRLESGELISASALGLDGS